MKCGVLCDDGCTDGVLSYSMPQGDHRDADVDLRDFTYDGHVTDHYLSGGLGQLTDGVEGHSNFRLDPDGWGRKGYEWVGWRNNSVQGVTTSSDSVLILFRFDQRRRFTGIRLHANNMFTRGVRVFRRAVIRVMGDDADSDLVSTSTPGPVERRVVVYDHRRDRLIDFARNVVITLPDLVGSLVSVQLFFDATWMLVSEVRFESGAPLACSLWRNQGGRGGGKGLIPQSSRQNISIPINCTKFANLVCLFSEK